jgi:hypothetical protein
MRRRRPCIYRIYLFNVVHVAAVVHPDEALAKEGKEFTGIRTWQSATPTKGLTPSAIKSDRGEHSPPALL